jgi:transcriptional regulator with PAS, ATPase and Fis domain
LKEKKQTELSLDQRMALPENAFLVGLTAVLDELDICVVIMDCHGKICYFNNCYLQTYEDVFRAAGILPTAIIGTDVSGKTRGDAVLNTLNSTHSYKSEYFHDPDTGEYGYAEMIPFHTDTFHGVAVVQQEGKKARALIHEINHYKHLTSVLQQKLKSKDSLPDGFQNIIGESPIFIQTMQMAARVADSSSSVCILGESGTGKEMFAEAIHRSSPFAGGPLVKINCAAIPESLMESELFGYEKGAFTGADSKGKAGKFELANNGTLFLDEIGEMPLSMQVKLLRALQEKTVVRIGGSKPIRLNFRLITATNQNLEQMVAKGSFREDLYYRICIIPIHLPPLRERKSDISLLADYFLTQLPDKSTEKRHFSDLVLDQFQQYQWPGNIRELRNTTERMAVLCPTAEITSEYLPPLLTQPQPETPGGPAADLEQFNLHKMTAKMEYDTIRTVLNLTNGNKAQAIKILGISKRTFYMKLEKYGLG